jgi:hypothetical protein
MDGNNNTPTLSRDELSALRACTSILQPILTRLGADDTLIQSINHLVPTGSSELETTVTTPHPTVNRSSDVLESQQLAQQRVNSTDNSLMTTHSQNQTAPNLINRY